MRTVEDVILSPEFQVTIPRQFVEQMGLKSGEKIKIISSGNRIELIPVRPIKAYRGMFKGEDLSIERDDEDRL